MRPDPASTVSPHFRLGLPLPFTPRPERAVGSPVTFPGTKNIVDTSRVPTSGTPAVSGPSSPCLCCTRGRENENERKNTECDTLEPVFSLLRNERESDPKRIFPKGFLKVGRGSPVTYTRETGFSFAHCLLRERLLLRFWLYN